DFSAILQLLYAGDAAERAVAAYALGRPESSRASGAGYQAPHLAALLDDPYSALRLVAYRALRVQPGFADFAYDFLAPPELRRDSVSRALEIARQHAPHSAEGRLLLSPDGTPEPSTIAELRAARDDRPITIAE
ncbi:MAG TPA: hypothetical protein VGP93_07595, partial [Polyangiaceae bacterium]|nr:hypothetical protein [Polyangiaceae bacterium]